VLRDRIAEQPARTRLSVAILFHAASLSRFWNSGNVDACGRCLSDPWSATNNGVRPVWPSGLLDRATPTLRRTVWSGQEKVRAPFNSAL